MADTNQADLTDTTIVGANQLDAANGGTAATQDSFSLAELNTLLGKDFKDKAAAFKSVGDTFKFVGKRKEDVAAELRALSGETETTTNAQSTASANSDVSSLRNEIFFLSHPEYKGFESIINKMGASNPAETVATPEFKMIFDKMKEADTVTSTRSVVSSNSRIGLDKSKTDEAIALANARRGSDVADVLAAAVLESLTQ